MSPWRFLASGFGAGYAPKAPGTFGSLVGLALGAVLLNLGHVPLLAGVVVASGLGLYATRRVGCAAQDPGWIVIDEIAGQMLTLLALPHLSLLGLVASFALFRLFDILKPGPVGWADARHDEWGVMGDDILAGLLAAAVILLLRLVLPL
jgi:phosphatidylglycerophosphatase A